jgi:hypothetical protein
MRPKQGKPLRLFNPFAIWTDIALRSGEAMLASTQAAVTRIAPKVAVIPSGDAPPPNALRAKAPRRKAASKPKQKKRRAKR